ncbi:lysoplasmalogenase-like protein TMEM86A [Dinothrombium tinctorium]|uniref:lysoplasmalogenase n=1 Tax=Dinothrombium tinctorium TaxID=1965070 RepID=A0A3S3NUQ1_9ACAR|nr:lysoplasmalogenase-like protein TMEM86A [Dinothrombium tinctorium]
MGKNEKIAKDWTDPRSVLKCIGPKLVPFFKTVAIYFVLADRESETWLTVVLKCLPLIWLCIFVVINGISFKEKHTYSRRILLGLVFSMIGDAFLVGSSTFLYGLFSFSVAHLFYIAAFGFQPLNAFSGFITFIIGSVGYSILYPRLNGFYEVAVPYYITLLSVMLWRSLARVQFADDGWTWTSLSSCVGGILFTISDTLLGLNTFGVNTGLSPKLCQALTMITYYTAQMGIALSVVDNKSICVLTNNKKKIETKTS